MTVCRPRAAAVLRRMLSICCSKLPEIHVAHREAIAQCF